MYLMHFTNREIARNSTFLTVKVTFMQRTFSFHDGSLQSSPQETQSDLERENLTTKNKALQQQKKLFTKAHDL